MSRYSFFFQRGANAIPDFDFDDFSDDEQALSAAQFRLASHSTAHCVEVFNESRRIGVVQRSESRVARALRAMTVSSLDVGMPAQRRA